MEEYDYGTLAKCVSKTQKTHKNVPSSEVERICEDYIIGTLGGGVYLLKSLIDRAPKVSVKDLSEKQRKIYDETYEEMKRKRSREVVWGSTRIGKINPTASANVEGRLPITKVWNTGLPEDSLFREVRHLYFWRGKPGKTQLTISVINEDYSDEPEHDMTAQMWVTDARANNLLRYLTKLGYDFHVT